MTQEIPVCYFCMACPASYEAKKNYFCIFHTMKWNMSVVMSNRNQFLKIYILTLLEFGFQNVQNN